MILCEGYTDVLAAAPGGRAPTRRDHGHVAHRGAGRRAGAHGGGRRVLELCLDADSAGQQAMLSAAALAAAQASSCGSCRSRWDRPRRADRDGGRAGASRALRPRCRSSSSRSSGCSRLRDQGSAEGKDRAIAELRPVLAGVPRRRRCATSSCATCRGAWASRGTSGACSQAAAGRPAVAGRPVAASRMTATTASPARAAPRRRSLRRRGSPSAPFLALCIALPDRGEAALARIDLDEHF